MVRGLRLSERGNLLTSFSHVGFKENKRKLEIQNKNGGNKTRTFTNRFINAN